MVSDRGYLLMKAQKKAEGCPLALHDRSRDLLICANSFSFEYQKGDRANQEGTLAGGQGCRRDTTRLVVKGVSDRG